jgi:hypothetical protein
MHIWSLYNGKDCTVGQVENRPNGLARQARGTNPPFRKALIHVGLEFPPLLGGKRATFRKATEEQVRQRPDRFSLKTEKSTAGNKKNGVL